MTELSVLIPSRNELFLARTIADILEHAEADTEIVAVLDGAWAEPRIPQHERVTIVYHPESIGQRAACNEAARIATGKYLMKTDAHCSFAQGFDRVLLADIQDDWTVAPLMRNLHVFDWVCLNGHRRYQSPSGPCLECGKPTKMDIVWRIKPSPNSTAYCFDPTPHFQYFNEFKKRPEGQGPISETMSLQGSCFMLTREKYFDLNICDESFGSWGSQGIEVACKTWLSGGRVVCNQKTFYGHAFRTQGGDWGFPYPISGKQVEHAKSTARDLFFKNKWPKQIYPLSWLVERFWPVPGWSDKDLMAIKEVGRVFRACKFDKVPDPKKEPIQARILGLGLSPGIVYYTDNKLDPTIMNACKEQIWRNLNGHQLVSVSLQPIDFGRNIVLPLDRHYLSMFKQILAGLEALDSDYVFMAEHDILYHPSHFDFVPPQNDKYFYNLNFWKVRYPDGHALHFDAKQVSGLCAYRELLVRHYRERVKRTEAKLKELGDSRAFRNWIRAQGFEPGAHHRPERVDDYGSDVWRSAEPNLDIRHDANLTPNRWSQDEFRDKKNCQNWQEADHVDGWYQPGKFSELLKER